jgi:hypothetical protein
VGLAGKTIMGELEELANQQGNIKKKKKKKVI